MKMKTQIKQYELQQQKIEQYFNSRAYRLKQKKKKRRHKARANPEQSGKNKDTPTY